MIFTFIQTLAFKHWMRYIWHDNQKHAHYSSNNKLTLFFKLKLCLFVEEYTFVWTMFKMVV